MFSIVMLREVTLPHCIPLGSMKIAGIETSQDSVSERHHCSSICHKPPSPVILKTGLTRALASGIVAFVAHELLGSPSSSQRRNQNQHSDLTSVLPRAILRHVVPPSSHRSRGRRNNSVLGLSFSLAKRAGRVARDVARCRLASPLADPWFFIRP